MPVTLWRRRLRGMPIALSPRLYGPRPSVGRRKPTLAGSASAWNPGPPRPPPRVLRRALPSVTDRPLNYPPRGAESLARQPALNSRDGPGEAAAPATGPVAVRSAWFQGQGHRGRDVLGQLGAVAGVLGHGRAGSPSGAAGVEEVGGNARPAESMPPVGGRLDLGVLKQHRIAVADGGGLKGFPPSS